QFNFADASNPSALDGWNDIILPSRVNGTQTQGGQVFSDLVDSEDVAVPGLSLTMDDDNVFAGASTSSNVTTLSDDAAAYFADGVHDSYAWGYTRFGSDSPTYPRA